MSVSQMISTGGSQLKKQLGDYPNKLIIVSLDYNFIYLIKYGVI